MAEPTLTPGRWYVVAFENVTLFGELLTVSDTGSVSVRSRTSDLYTVNKTRIMGEIAKPLCPSDVAKFIGKGILISIILYVFCYANGITVKVETPHGAYSFSPGKK